MAIKRCCACVGWWQVENFTVSLSDGRALCYLVHHYNSAVLPRHQIRDQTFLSCGVARPSLEDGDSRTWTAADVDELLANEKFNFKLLYGAVSTEYCCSCAGAAVN